MDIPFQEIRTDPGLLARLCAAKEFAGSERQQTVLKFLFWRHFEGPAVQVTDQDILAKCFPPSGDDSRARKTVFDIRGKLVAYFARSTEEAEPIKVEIELDTYRLVFSPNKPTFESAGRNLDFFWKPYLVPARTVMLMADDVPDFCDLTPKIQLSPPFQSPNIEVRGDIMVGSGQSATFLPAGVLSAASKFSNFLGRNGIAVEFDVSLKAPTPTGSLIVMGEDPFFRELRVWPTRPVFAHSSELYWADLRRKEKKDELINKNPLRCAYYVTVERMPITKYPGVYKTLITAYHSVAVEAAAAYLTSEKSVSKIVKEFSPDKDALPEYIAVLLKVTCAVLEPKAMGLRPGIPRIYLDIIGTDLLQVEDEPFRIFTSPPESVQAEMENVDRLVELEKQGALDGYDHNVDLMEKYGYDE